MTEDTRSLDDIAIAAPCSARWDDMRGDDRVRFCELCALSVFDLSGMSRAEAEALVLERTGRLCVRMLRRADGTVLTRNCPVGLRQLHRQLVARIARAAALVGLVLAGLVGCARRAAPAGAAPPVGTIAPSAGPQQVLGEVEAPPVMGRVVAPSPAPASPPAELGSRDQR